MRVILDDNGSSKESLQFFSDHIDDFKPVKKLVVFRDSENFIFTEYAMKRLNVNMVLENWNGDQLHLKNLNCGYYGDGPGGTLEVISKLGITDLKSFEYKDLGHPGIEILFREDGTVKDIINSQNAIFYYHQAREYNEVRLGRKYILVNTISQKIYIRNPQKTCAKGLLTLIDHSEFESMEYWLGDESPLEDRFRASDYFEGANQYNELTFGADEVNLVLNGKNYKICCLVAKSELIDLINCIWLYLNGEKILDDNIIFKKNNFYDVKSGVSFFGKIGWSIGSKLSENCIYRKIEKRDEPGDKQWLMS
jgi:hypothetical protein